MTKSENANTVPAPSPNQGHHHDMPAKRKAKRAPGAGRKKIDPKLKRVSKNYRLAPKTLLKILRYQVSTGIKTEVGALEAMLAHYEPV